MTRILVMASTFPRWELDTAPPFVYHLSAGLAQRGYEVHVLTPHTRGAARDERLGPLHVHRFRYATDSWESLCYGGGILQNLRRRPARWSLVPAFLGAELLAMLRLVNKHKIDLVHAHWVLPQGLVAAVGSLWMRCPVVITGHGGDVFATRSLVRKLPVKFATRKAARCTVNSNAMSAELRHLTDVEPVVIPMGVDTTRFPYFPPDQPGFQTATPLGPRILFVGRLVEKKGVRYLIEAMPKVLESTPGAVLTVVGDGPEKDSLMALVARLGLKSAVRFMGSVPNDTLSSYYAESNVFVAPSVRDRDGDTEALGVVILEAAASGTPIVATNVGGIPDIVVNNKTGLLVAGANPDELARAILRLVTDSEFSKRLACNARKLVEARFDWDSVVERFDALFRDVLNREGMEFIPSNKTYDSV